jgi:hypothetical protein
MATWPMATSRIDASPSQKPASSMRGLRNSRHIHVPVMNKEHGTMTAPNDQREEQDRRRRRAVRTAWVVGTIAVGVYVAFILSGVLGAA